MYMANAALSAQVLYSTNTYIRYDLHCGLESIAFYNAFSMALV